MALLRKFDALVQDVIVVGCGGTGSRTIPLIVQLLKTAPAAIGPALYLIDGDEVESKNLTRQNFIEMDVGRNKAVVLAERYSQALDFPVHAHPHFVNEGGDILREINRSASDSDFRQLGQMRKIWILAVDSIKARMMVLQQAGHNDIIIDAGNMDTFGQVSIYDNVHLECLPGEFTPELLPFQGDYALPFVPSPLTSYVAAVINPPVATGSCADLDQSLAINNLMSAGIVGMLQNLIYNNEFYTCTNSYDLHRGNQSTSMNHTWFNETMGRQRFERQEFGRLGDDLPNRLYDNLQSHSQNFLMAKNMETRRGSMVHDLLSDIRAKTTAVDPAVLAALGL